MMGTSEKERLALAMLRSGASWKDASIETGIPVDRLHEIWNDNLKVSKNGS